MELTYRQEGDYLLPNLEVPESPKIGKYGMLRRDYLMDHHEAIYTGMLLRGTLNPHLEEIDRSANEMYELLIKQYAAREGVTEQLKAENQMEWIRRMNDLRQMADEVIYQDLVMA